MPAPKTQSDYGDIDLVSVPDSTEYFIGWRGWSVALDLSLKVARLKSPSYALGHWVTDGPCKAYCSYAQSARERKGELVTPTGDPHGDPPGVGCTCGFYAAYPVENCVVTHKNYCYSLLGAVKAWGKVIRGDKGFRAQYMQPLAFLEPSNYIPHRATRLLATEWAETNQVRFPHDTLMFDLASAYNVPILPSITFKHLTQERVLELIGEDIRETGYLPGNGLRVVQQWLSRR